MASHLTTLIKRVRSISYKLKNEPAFYSKLINLAEYLRYEEDYSDFEKRKASAILKAYNMDYLLNIPDEISFEEEIKKIKVFREKGYVRSCMRCGRTLTNPDSIKRGYGDICLSKRLQYKNTDLRNFFNRLGDKK